MKLLKILFLNMILLISLSGCVSTLFFAGTATSTAMTAQEVDEEYNGSLVDYVVDKTESLYEYLSDG